MNKIDIVCVTYRHGPKLEVFLNCLMAQTSLNFCVTVIHDGPDEKFDEVARRYGALYPDLMRFVCTAERHNDYGHTLRDVGIGMAEHDWLLLTNGDNYYCPVFIETMLKATASGDCELVVCDMLHSHTHPGGRAQAPYRYFETQPVRRSIDIGCFIVKTEIAKRTGFRDKTFDGDATYVEDLLATGGITHWRKIEQALLVHN
ncbi:glycosyltransferase family A protein [Caballeronia sp. BR00000012568055]|uniref:glycosyltransferase family 2 protein n=1 Tax=Caballeronia sp. BR00000012568055 TaxID=2918761 RepID=UPI0023F8D0B9|nr:glycosyltransferase family A protein [Caballeronia sp. BR00000012568055]